MSLAWSLALHGLRTRPLRALLTALAMVVGVAVTLGVSATVNAVDAQSLAASAVAAGASQLDVRVGSGQGISTADVARIAALPGVAVAAPLDAKRVAARLAAANVQGTVVDVLGLQGSTVALRSLDVVEGRLPEPRSRSEVVLDQGLARVLAAAENHPPLRLGDTVQLTTGTGPDAFTIVGFSSGGGTSVFSTAAAYLSDTTLRAAFPLGLRTPLVALSLRPQTSPAAVADRVHALLSGPITTVDPRAAGGAPLREVEPMLLLITVLSLVIGAGATANSVALATSERRRETALLRAAGASARDVFWAFMAEIPLLALVAVPLGIAAGIGLAALLESRLAPPDLGLSAVDVGPGQVVLAAAVGFAAALVGGAVPAALGARAPILSGLRPHPAADRERAATMPVALALPSLTAGLLALLFGDATWVAVGSILVLAGVVAALPVLAPLVARGTGTVAALLTPHGRTAARNLERRRNRTALTLAGLTISVASAVAVNSLSAGASSGGDRWVSRLFAGDVVVRSPVTEADAVQQRFAAAPGVSAALPLRFFTVAAPEGAILGVTALDSTGYAARPSGLDVTSGSRTAALQTLHGHPALLVPSQLADRANLQPGSLLPLTTTDGPRTFTVAGIVDHSFPAGNGNESLVMDRSIAQRYFGTVASGFDDLDVVSNGHPADVAATAARYGLGTVTVDAIRAGVRRSIDHAVGLVAAVAVIALVLSMIAVVNTLAVNLRQGSQELAMLRAIGMARSGARALLLAEAAVLAASGAVIGAATGCLIVWGMLRVVASPGFTPPFVFPLDTIVALLAAVIGGSMLAALGPAIRASRSSIVAALRQD